MKYIYYKSKNGNFGDDLNGWLWTNIFQDRCNSNDANFFGIGSILNKETEKKYNIDSSEKKIVFGTGFRPIPGSKNKMNIDSTWDIKFLRGPLSSQIFNNKYDFITDAAYAFRQTEYFNTIKNSQKEYEISFMPYFHSIKDINWKKICDDIGINYISPLAEKGVLFTLEEIAKSKLLITEAMHGAILADSLRVPWHRFIFSTYYYENPYVSEFKWNDWLLSVKIEYPIASFVPYFEKIRFNRWINNFTNNYISINFNKKTKAKENVKSILSDYKNHKYHLSNDRILEEIDKKMERKLEEIINTK